MSQTPASQTSVDTQPAQAGELTYFVSEMSCDHCKASVTGELVKVPGVKAIGVDLDTKLVRVRGSNLDDGAVRAAIEDAGYAAVSA
jgi:copper chaperone